MRCQGKVGEVMKGEEKQDRKECGAIARPGTVTSSLPCDMIHTDIRLLGSVVGIPQFCYWRSLAS